MVNPQYLRWRASLSAITNTLHRQLVDDLLSQLAIDVKQPVSTSFLRRNLPPGPGPRERLLSTVRIHVTNITGIEMNSAELSDPDAYGVVTIKMTPRW